MSKLRTRILAFLLAVSMLVGYVLPAGAEADPPAAEPTGEVAPEPTPEPEVPPMDPAAQPELPEQPEVAPTQPAPEEPTEETEPEAPTEAEPTEAPTEPTQPEEPTQETDPVEPTEQTEPEQTEPEESTDETQPEEPEISYPEPMLFYAAPVEEYPVYGMNVVYPGTDELCWDFLVNAATAVRCGGTLYVTLGVSGSYPYLYLGSQAELEDRLCQGGPFPVVEGVNNNGEALFHFATGAGDNSRMTVCLVTADADCEWGYQVQERELAIPPVPTADATLPDVPQEDVIETVSVVFAAAPLQEQDITGKLYLAEKEQEAPYAPFTIEKATALRVEDVVYVTLYVTPGEGGFPYSNLYMGQLPDLVNLVSGGETASTVEGTADEQGTRQTYHFTLAAGQLGTRVPVCALGDDMTMEGILAAKELDLIVPAEVPEARKEPTPTPVSYPAAPFDEQDVSGKLFVAKQGVDTVYSMFKIETATAVRDENNIYVTVQVNPAASGAFTYSYLYFGTRTDLISQLDKGGPFDVVAGVNGSKQSYHFTLPLSAQGSRVPVCILKGDLNAKSPYNSSELELVIPEIPEGKAVPVPTPVSYPAAPFDEQDVSGKLFVAKQGADAIYPMFKIETATAVRDENNIYVTVQVNPAASGAFTYSYLYFGTRTDLISQLDKGGPFDVVAGVNGSKQSYHFTLPLSAQGSRVPVCILKGDLNAKSPYNSSELELVIPEIPEGKAVPVPTPVSYPAAPFDEQDVSGKLFVAKQGVDTVYSMFKIETATAVRDENNIYVTVQVNPAASGAFIYSYLYFGTRTDLISQLEKGGPFDVVTGVSGSKQSYHFTLPLSAQGSRVPVCILKGDLNAKSPYNSSELELVIPEIPEGKAVPVPTPVSYPAAPFDEQDVSGKLFVAKQGADAIYPMFKIETATAVRNENNIYVTVQVNPAASGAFTYSYLYFGTRTDLISQLDKGGPFDVVAGVNGSKQSYHFTLPLSAQGSRVPVCILKGDLNAKSPYNSSELELVIPEIPEGKAVPVPTPVSYPAAPFDAQDVSGKLFVAKQGADAIYPMFKIETATAVRDENNIYVTVQVNPAASGAFTYSYLYFGTCTDLISQLDKGGPFDVVAGVNGSKQSYHFTLPLSAQGSRVPVCILKGDLNAKSPYNSSELELVIPEIPEGKAVPVPTPVSYPAAPFDEQDVSGKLFVAKQGADAIYPMFKIETATAVRDENNIYVTVQVNPAASGAFTYSYLYFGTRTDLISQLDKSGPFDVVAGVNGSKQSYHFTLPLSAQGSRVPVCILKGDLNAKSPYNSSELELVIPEIPEGKAVPVPTPVSYPAASAPERDITGLAVVEQGTANAWGDFPVISATGIRVDDKLYITALVGPDGAGSFPYAYLYFGSRTQLEEQLHKGGAFDVVAGIGDGQKQSFHFTLPAQQAGTSLPVCLVKADLTAENPYNTTDLELVIPEIPEETAQAAPAIPALPDTLSEANIKVIKAEDGAPFKMFTADKTGMAVAGDTLLIHFETSNPSFDALYFGSKEDGMKSPYVQGIQKDGKWVFEFALPASYRGGQNPICLRKTDGTWYSNKDLLLSIPADSGDSATVKDDAGIIMAPTSSWNQVSFVIQTSSAMLLGDRIYVTITGQMGGTEAGNVADKLYLGSRKDEDKSSFVPGTCNSDGTTTFRFCVPADKQGTSIPAVVGYSSGIWHTNQDFFLNIPNFNRHFDAGYYTDGVYDLYGNAYAYLDKVDSRGLAIDDGSTLTVSGDKIIIKWVTRATDTDKLYFGQQTDAIAIREAQSIGGTPTGMLNYQEFTITLPRSSLSTGIPFVRHSPLWFADTNGWLEKQDYLVLADCLPRISDAPDDTGTTIAPAGMKMLAGGSEVEQMFVVTDSTATRKGDVITCTVTGRPYASGSGPADRLYLGAREDQDKSNCITGTVNADGSTTFTFDVPADNQGLSIRVVVSFEKTGWHTVQDYFLNIPNFDGTFDLGYYTDGVYDLYGNAYAELSRSQNKSFPVDKGSTLSVAGDKIVIKWVCRSSSYDMVYFGAASDDEAVRNAAAAKIADYPGEATWKMYTVTLPKSALASRIPVVRHSSRWYADSNGWLTTQDYLVLANRLPKTSDTPDVPAEPSKPGTEIGKGVYNTTAETGAAMFKVVKAVLDADGGKYRVTLTLSGTGYDYLCTGTAAQAPSQQSRWAPAKIVNCTINGETRDFYTYTLEIDDPTKPIAIASHSKKNDTWYDRTVTLDVSNLTRTARDGNYQVTANCDAAMFKIVDAKLKVVNGQMLVELTLNGTGYDYLYPGSGSQAEQDKANWAPFQKDGEGKYVYTLPITQLDAPIVISSHSAKKDMWYDRTVTFLSDSLKPIGGTEPTTPTEPTEPTTPTEPTEPTSPTEPSTNGTTSAVNSATKLKDGTYKQDGFTYSGGSGRVTIVCDKVIIKGGKSYAVIRFVSKSSGSTSMDYKYVKASNGVYYPAGDGSFTIPVELNANNRILGMTAKMTAAHEIEYTIYVQLKKAESAATSPTEPSTNGTTSAVNSATKLKDGTYKQDGFTYSGGSGRVTIVCDKVIIKGGKSYAVIRFVSKSSGSTSMDYKYVKASNGVYYPAGDGSFTIPVELNANNRILGMTAKMTAAHEIEYTIYVQLKKAESAAASTGGGGSLSKEKETDDPDSKLDKKAPEILGLEFKEVIQTPDARYLKLLQYDRGVVLAEVDLRRDTVLDTEEAIEELAQADLAAKARNVEAEQTDEPAETVQITSDYVAAQYRGDVLKYLLVPAGVELPAGLEKDYLIVHLPVKSTYLMDENLAQSLDALGALGSVSVLTVDCQEEALMLMIEEHQKLPGGTWQKPDYRTLIKAEVDLGLIGNLPLPLSREALEERKQTAPAAETLSPVEYRDRLTNLTDRFAVLDIPLILDRSADEPEARGRAAWMKLYGILYGKQELANRLYDAAVAKEEK